MSFLSFVSMCLHTKLKEVMVALVNRLSFFKKMQTIPAVFSCKKKPAIHLSGRVLGFTRENKCIA